MDHIIFIQSYTYWKKTELPKYVIKSTFLERFLWFIWSLSMEYTNIILSYMRLVSHNEKREIWELFFDDKPRFQLHKIYTCIAQTYPSN